MRQFGSMQGLITMAEDFDKHSTRRSRRKVATIPNLLCQSVTDGLGVLQMVGCLANRAKKDQNHTSKF